ncbi:contactin-associated protein-like 3B [Amphiura filiformis]|uniref:contactin-associated protein-like 3B n=1 Tax=Amphiura filiformis TaxID=82378 RepID=UPI003B21B420
MGSSNEGSGSRLKTSFIFENIFFLTVFTVGVATANVFSQKFQYHQEYVLANNNFKVLDGIGSVISCASHCVSYAQCRGFSFSASQHQCEIKDTLADCSLSDLQSPVSDEVYYHHRPDQPCTRSELSLQGLPSSQSSLAGGVPSRAIDGDKRTSWLSSTCTHTASGYGQWWVVDMQKTTCIKKVVIYNRSDCCKNRLTDAVIRIGTNSNMTNPECGPGVTSTQVNSGSIIHMSCDLCGRYLSVNLPATKGSPLTICEILAYVDECPTNAALPSCAAIRNACYSSGSGTYEIDPDGPNNGVEPFTAQCDMNSGTTIIGHNSEDDIETPSGFETHGSYIKEIVYQASIPQITALIEISTHCEQYIKYECYETAFIYGAVWNVWWVSRDGDNMYNWGSVPTGTSACSCSLQSGCDTGGICNCVTNDGVWRSDEGVLSDKSKLPVTKIHSGDTGVSYEKAIFTLGALRCFG